jgi:hypothetical protein
MFFRRRKRPKSAAELANEAEIEKLSEEATLGELENEVQAIAADPLRGARPSGFFNSPGVKLKDDQPYGEEPSSAD